MLFCLFLSCSPGEQKKSVATEKNIGKVKFVLACGSGCTLIYREKKITKLSENYEITFHVTMYEDDVKSDAYNITYELSCIPNNFVIKCDGKEIEKESQSGNSNAERALLKFVPR
jgi:hypothetical protein